MDIISINKTIKANEDQDFRFCDGSEKSRFKLFLKLFVGLTLTLRVCEVSK